MIRSRGASTSRSPDKIFAGVRFVLFGFDSVSEAQYRSELVRSGGVDIGRYDLSCTHVIVSGRVYDDPVCVVARNDGKVLVTELWIDDSVDLGTLADPTRILYWPVKDLNGIPGSELLFICLTGYQRPEREDIMKMVSLMGARFSKPLIANQVTHLICYKFEGEKYELAKKVNIKLINHRWLEDCLKAWEILPIDDYTKSGWELEILEAEARDSEEETEDGTRVLGLKNNAGNSSFQDGMPVSVHSDTSIPSMGTIGIYKDTGAAKQPHSADDSCMNNRLFTTPCKGTASGKALAMSVLSNKVGEEFGHHTAGDIEQAGDGYAGGLSFIPFDINLKKQDNKLLTDKLGSTSNSLAEKSTSLSYSRRTPHKSVLPEEPSNNSLSSPIGVMKGNTSSMLREATVNDDPADMQGPAASASIHHTEAISNSLPQKRKISVTGVGSKSPKSECQGSKSSAPQSPLAYIRPAQLEPTTAMLQDKSDIAQRYINSPVEEGSNSNSGANQSKPSSIYRKKSLKCGQPGSGTKIVDTTSSPSDAKEADLPSLRRAIDENVVRRLPNLKSTITSAKASPTDSKLLPDLSHDNEPRQAADKHASLRNTLNHFGSLAIEGRIAEEASSKEKISEVSLGGLGESECAIKCNNHDNAMNDLPSAKEPPELHNPRHDEAALSPNRRELETRKSMSTASSDTCKGNNVKAASGAYTRKAVAKRTMNNRPKPTAGSTRKDKVVTNSDKAAALEAGVKSGKPEKVSSNLVLEKAASDEINGAAQSVSKDVVMEDRVEVAQHFNSASNNKNVAMDWMEASMDPEKENKSEENGSLTFKSNGNQSCKMVPQHDRKLMQKNKDAAGVDTRKMQTRKDRRVISSEPVWFILSGHRLQRKEFQMLIKHLRGRVCRDSHHWSYQATHFIAPDPVRRTEKFFAAAAAGRWILKTDYLTASNEAGKFLEEEPFEWYRNGLTEDGAISLEAPRKWRLLRERTGHGAFHGMQVIVYGECIAPTLDTLKRAVKAGDGTILATSPPYTRFLKSGSVDYAVVSPSMPRVDLWVQEFLRHEIPCVVADYLVEYVCKPGYSLERHVLYKTHAWAEKSFANLLSRSEDIIADALAPSEESNDDLGCSVCGSRDRGEVMLICGDETGSIGCGIGTHIDCCDPPLEAVPDGDWYCSKCCRNASKTPSKGSKKIFTQT